MNLFQGKTGNAYKKIIALTIVLALFLGVFNVALLFQNINQQESIAQLQSQIEELQQKEDQEVVSSYVEESQVIDTVEAIKESVVSIVATKDLPKYRGRSFMFDDFFNDPFFNNFFDTPQRQVPDDINETERVQVGGGSGFIYSSDGLILTNKHVVSDTAAEYTVVLYDGTELEAKVLALNDFNDIAVVKVTGEEVELRSVELGDSSELRVGQRVVAIGNALAEFENTVTTGIISAKGREIVASDGRSAGEQIENLIQTDAAINPGNSGGPLVNLKGQVVGMNTAIAQGANGIGFAIPVNDLKHFAQVVEKNGKFVRPFLGVRYMMLSDDMAEKLNVEATQGALLFSDVQAGIPAVVPDSPADKAGLKMSDVIIEVDGEVLTQERDLRSVIAEKEIGQKLLLKVLRNGQELEIELKLEEFDSVKS